MILGAIAVGLCVLLAVAVLALARSLSHMQHATDAIKDEVAALRAQVTARDGDLARVDELIDRADKISSRVESTSKTLAAPVIKAFALGAGTRSAAQRLRRNSANGRRAEGAHR